MPNWCSTNYVVEGPKKDLDIIYKAICDVIQGKAETQEGSVQNWEGNVLHALHIPSELENPNRVAACMRGFIYDYPTWDGENEDRLRFAAEEAWARTNFAEALKIRFKDIRIYWSAEEPGCDYYVTNDAEGVYFGGFVADTEDGTEYFDSLEEVYRFLGKCYDCHCEEDVVRYNEEHDSWICIHEFAVDTDEFSFGDVPLIGVDTNLFNA